jgi:hypothetical protein
VCSASIQKGERVRSLDPLSEFSFSPLIPPVGFLCRESTGTQMNQAAASLVSIMEDYESFRYGESLSLYLFFIQIFFGNIILRHLMRANLLLFSVTSVLYARHCVGLEHVSFLDQLAHTLRIRSFDVGQSL